MTAEQWLARLIAAIVAGNDDVFESVICDYYGSKPRPRLSREVGEELFRILRHRAELVPHPDLILWKEAE